MELERNDATRRPWPLTLGAGLAVVGLAVAGVLALEARSQATASADDPGGKPMPFATTKSSPTSAIPPIDAAAPATTETATFALG